MSAILSAPERLAQRVDVEHGVGRRVEGAPRPDAVGAVGDRLRA